MEVQEHSTSRVLQSLLTGYVRWFNRTHGRRGHLFQGRYKAIVCERDNYLLELVRYIHLNPVRAKIVKRPGDWAWSGHGEYLGTEKLRLIDAGPVREELKTVARYEAFIRDGIKEQYRPEWHPGDHAPFLGPKRFVKKLAKEQRSPPLLRRLTLEGLLRQIGRQTGLNTQILRRRGRTAKLVKGRDRFICEAVLERGYLGSEVAEFLGCHPSNVSRAVQKKLGS